MQESILGSLCFLVFLSSFSTAQNSEDLKTGFVEEDEVKSNEEHRYYENEDDSWERSPFRPHPGLYSENYRSILGESNPYSSFGSYSPVYGLGPSYSDADALSHTQTFPSGFGSSYTSAEASANADALAQLNLYGSPYGSGYFGTGSGLIYPGGASNTNGPTLNLVQAQSDAQVANSGLSYSYPLSDTDLFSTGHSSSLMSSGTNAYNQGIGSGLGSGDHLALNQFSTGLSSANSNAQAIASSSGSASSYASANSGVQAQSLIGQGSSSVNAQSKSKAQAFSSGGTAISIASARDFEGVQSRTIPRDEYIIIPGADDIIICTNAGELHNVWSAGYDCLICACVLQNGYLSPVCVTCDLCAIPIQISPIPPLIPSHPSGPNFPQVPPIIPSSTPGPTLDTEVSCDPLPTNTPFQNPLNHCQICICQYSFGLNPDVRITCEDIPTCDVPPSDSIVIPPIPEPPAPVPLPTCEKFPPNVVFPHPFDICQSCECVVIADVPQLEHNIVCYPTPGCEPLLPSLPSTTITTTTTPVPPTELLPWPPLPSLPPGPLPGPLPHKSCAPYPPNQQFQHPWDDCQICVCSEIYSTGVVNIEVNCFTNPVCCRDYPVLRPYTNLIAEGSLPFELQETLATPGSLTVPTRIPPYVATRPSTSLNPVLPQVPNSNSPQHFVSPALPQLKHLDVMCKSREIGIDFLYDRCRICSCEVFGNLVLPVCRRSNLPECTVMSAPVPVGNIVYIEPRCRSRPPWQTFMSGCHSCICHSVFSYVVAKCKPVPGCDKGQSPQSETNKAEAFANSQIGSYNHAYGFPGSQSLAKANAAASLGSSGISGHEGYPPRALTDTQMGSIGYPYGFQSSQSLAEANAATFSGSMVSADSQAGTSFSYPYGGGNQQYLQSLAQTNAAASSGLSKLPKPEIYPIRDIGGTQTGSYNYPYGFEISQNLADANAAAFSEAGGSGIGGYQFAPGSSGYSYADPEALANAYSGSSVYGVLPYKYYPSSGLGQTGSHSQAAAEAEVVSTLYPRPHGQPVPLYKPGIFQQAGNLVQSIADTSANALGLSHGSGYFSRPQIKTGEEELVE